MTREIGESPRSLQFDLIFEQDLTYRRMLRDRDAKLHPIVRGILFGKGVGPLGDAQGLAGYAESGEMHEFQHVGNQTHAGLPDQDSG